MRFGLCLGSKGVGFGAGVIEGVLSGGDFGLGGGFRWGRGLRSGYIASAPRGVIMKWGGGWCGVGVV